MPERETKVVKSKEHGGAIVRIPADDFDPEIHTETKAAQKADEKSQEGSTEPEEVGTAEEQAARAKEQAKEIQNDPTKSDGEKKAARLAVDDKEHEVEVEKKHAEEDKKEEDKSKKGRPRAH